MNKELSKEEIRIKWIRQTPLLHLDDCVDNAMQQYADQEKKKEAIAFAEWMGDKCDKDDENGLNPFLINNDGRWMQACGNSTSWTTEQLYEIYNQQK